MPALIFPRATAIIDVFERSRFHRCWITVAFRGAEHFLCQGPTWRDFAITAIGFSAEKSPIIRNWTATESLLTIGASRREKEPSERPRFHFVEATSNIVMEEHCKAYRWAHERQR